MANSISDIIKTVMITAGIKRKELAEEFGLSRDSMDQKFQKSTWDVSDLARVAEITGASLEFSFPNGTRIPIPIVKPVRRRIAKKKDIKDHTDTAIPADEGDQHLNTPLASSINNESQSENVSDDDEIPYISEEDDACVLPVYDNTTVKDKNNYNPPEEKPSFSANPSQEEIPMNNVTVPSQDDTPESTIPDDSYYSGDYRPVKYQTDRTPVNTGSVGKNNYIARSNKQSIISRAEQIINSEAPIHKDILMERILSSFGVKKTAEAISATSAVLSSRHGFNCNKVKKDVFFWKKNKDPEQYKVFRVGEEDLDKVCLYDLKNAICYTLKQNTQNTGSIMMDVNDLLKEVSTLFNLQRLGNKAKAVLTKALEFSRNVGAIEGKGQISLKESSEEMP